MFWIWLLKYSSFWLTGIVALIVGYVLDRLTTRRADLVYYTSHIQWITLPPPTPNAAPVGPIGTFTLFLWNAGKAPARDVHVGHYLLPGNNVFPDIPRETVATPGGGKAIRFALIPPKTVISISYLFFGVMSLEQIISYVGWEGGGAKKIPVLLQRVWPRWYLTTLWVVFLAGLWVLVNALVSLIQFLWLVYYAKH
jgi:hypothetical protein